MEDSRSATRHPQNNTGSHDSFCKATSLSNVLQTNPTSLRFLGNGGRDRIFTAARSLGAIGSSFRVSIPDVSGFKTRRRVKTYPKPKAPKRFLVSKEIPSAKPSESALLSSERRLFSKAGSPSGLFSHSHSAISPKIPLGGAQGAGSSDDQSSIRPVNGSSDVCSLIKLDGRSSPRSGYKSDRLSRRLPPRFPEPGHLENANGPIHLLSSRFGLGNKFREIEHRAANCLRVPWAEVGHGQQQGFSAAPKNSFSLGRPCEDHKNSSLVLEVCQKGNGKDEFRRIFSSAGKAQVQDDPEGCSIPSGAPSKEKFPSSSGGLEGHAMVVGQYSQGLCNLSRGSEHISGDGCIGHGLGCSCRKPLCPGLLGRFSEKNACEPKGNVCGLSCRRVSTPPSSGKISTSAVGQQVSGLLYSQSGGHSFEENDRSCENPFLSSPKNWICSYCALHSGSSERSCGQPLQEKVYSRLVPVEECGSKNIQKMGQTIHRPFCLGYCKSSEKVCVERCQGFSCSFHGCVQPGMGFSAGLGVSAPVSDSSGLEPPQYSQRSVHFDCTPMGKGVLEGGSSKPRNRSPVPDPKPSASSSERSNRKASSSSTENIFGGLEGTGWSHITRDWLKEDSDLLASSWRRSTLKTYSAPWKQWSAWCKERGKSPSHPSPSDLAQYLSFLHRVKNFSAATVRVHKSVVATFSDPTAFSNLSCSPLVKHMIKAVELSSQVSPKKFIWDVGRLISWMTEEDLDLSSLFQVSRRLALILLLASGRRVHDLTLLSIDPGSMTLTDDSVCFWPAFGSKSDSTKHHQSGWQLLKNKNGSLDPVFWLDHYLTLSAHRRKARSGLISLFISTKGVVCPASRSVIAGWVKSALNAIGISSSAGSIRSAVASARRDSNVPLDLILKCGNWSGVQNLMKHYFREVRREGPAIKPALISDTFVPI